jgi:hypothetical protein
VRWASDPFLAVEKCMVPAARARLVGRVAYRCRRKLTGFLDSLWLSISTTIAWHLSDW